MTYSRSIVSFALVAALAAGSVSAQTTSSPQTSPTPQTPPSAQAPASSTPGGSATDESSGTPSFDDIAKGKKSIGRSDVPKDVEALKTLRAHFPEADTNHDGKVDKGEYDAYVSKSSQPTQRR